MVPFLDKYSSLTIGLTLLTIGGLGLYESFGGGGHAHAEPTAAQPPLAFSGAAAAGGFHLVLISAIPWSAISLQ